MDSGDIVDHWFDAKDDLDVTTLKLAKPTSEAWLFSIRPGQAPIGTFIAVVGYPLGQGESYTNGKLLARKVGGFFFRFSRLRGTAAGLSSIRMVA